MLQIPHDTGSQSALTLCDTVVFVCLCVGLVSCQWEREPGDISSDPHRVLHIFLVSAWRCRQGSGSFHSGQSAA